MNDYNIEFCHIYAGEKLNKEHFDSINKYLSFINKHRSKKIISVILIDDYNSKKTFHMNNFIKSFQDLNTYPDFLVFEKDMINSARMFIKKIPEKELIKNSNTVYLENKPLPILLKKYSKYSCAFLISCWILARFGIYKIPVKNLTNASFSAKKLVTILPKKYKNVELKAKKIISKTKYSYLLKNMDYIFF